MPKLVFKPSSPRQHDEWVTEIGELTIDTPQKRTALKQLVQRRIVKDRGKENWDFEGDDAELVQEAKRWKEEVTTDASVS